MLLIDNLEFKVSSINADDVNKTNWSNVAVTAGISEKQERVHY